MDFLRQTTRRLYAEHAATYALLDRFEQGLAGRGRVWPPAAGDTVWPELARAVAAALETEVTRHFAFEEERLFPRLREGGADDMATLLAEEHVVILEVAGRVDSLLRRAGSSGLDPAGWQALRVGGRELCERLAAHAHKEDSALLPLLDELLDEDLDRELFYGYAVG